MSIARTLAPVKSTRILFSSQAPVNRVRTFGLGVYPQRDRLPIGPSTADRAWAAAHLNADADASEAELFDERACRTMSEAEYRVFVDDCRAAEADRYARVHEAELDELRTFSDDYLAALAADAAMLDRACSGVSGC